MVSIGQFVLYTHDGDKWVDMTWEVNTAHKKIEIKFMHPLCPSRSYTWPKHDGIYWVPITNIFFTENTILDFYWKHYVLVNREAVLFTQWRSKIYPTYSTLISFYMITRNTVTKSIFLKQINHRKLKHFSNKK